MKGKRQILVGMLLGVLTSWGLVFISLPFIIKKFSFLLGFIACLFFVFIGLLLFILWREPRFLSKLLGREKIKTDSSQTDNIYNAIRLMLFVMVLLSLLISSYVLYRQDEWSKAQLQFQQDQRGHEVAMLEAERNSGNMHLLSHLLTKVDEELKTQPSGKLNEETIARIAAMSYTFTPYRKAAGESLSEQKSSPERGQLLLALVNMGIDSTSFAQIKNKTTFAGADLEGANLRGLDLSGINLRGANLKEADLRKANLRKADLQYANGWAANFEKALLYEADLRRANMQWANFLGAGLKIINLEGADLTCAKMSRVNLEGAHLSWVVLNEAFLNGANLSGVDLSGANMKRANLEGADLSDTKLRWIHLTDANVKNADLSRADCNGAYFSGADLTMANLTETYLYRTTIEEENWFEKLEKWQVIGNKGIQEKFKIVKDPFGEANYRLFPVEQ